MKRSTKIILIASGAVILISIILVVVLAITMQANVNIPSPAPGSGSETPITLSCLQLSTSTDSKLSIACSWVYQEGFDTRRIKEIILIKKIGDKTKNIPIRSNVLGQYPTLYTDKNITEADVGKTVTYQLKVPLRNPEATARSNIMSIPIVAANQPAPPPTSDQGGDYTLGSQADDCGCTIGDLLNYIPCQIKCGLYKATVFMIQWSFGWLNYFSGLDPGQLKMP